MFGTPPLRPTWALLAVVALAVLAQRGDAIVEAGQRFHQAKALAKGEGATDKDEILSRGPIEFNTGFFTGLKQYVTLRPVCSASALGIFTKCWDQFSFVLREFGWPVFEPGLTADDLTVEFLSQMPLPPSRGCCHSAFTFQTNLCGCDPETIRAIRNLLLFDPMVTVPFAKFLYGDICGAPVILEEDCPNGNPFDILKAQGRK